ncbi:4-hydroxy-tetrahydrodipicolinate synthase [Rothia sp. ZJ932]|uniref:4-hydroxy-tetrahydrodipicolinate synthase n=1 Tax=Rothia sp. ZJ932 TaxID=2810516 RepID=UPI001967DA73|nr:4-hydroxy-tetrahydrodipicolinate synthase [Rothia sp. ZJ932]QRZ61087.1 4-hydroxy-tetrahydrodipicolinate synthase [Rothia sp. ZJ932]
MSQSQNTVGTFAEPIFGRLLTAMVTPFADDGSVDETATAELALHLADRGHDGLVVCGTTGEYSTMTDEENERVFDIVKDAVGDRVKIIAGVGSNDTNHTLNLVKAADRVGVDGLLVVTPYYNKPTQAGLVGHFTEVARSSDTPVMLYDIPGRAGIPIAIDTYKVLAELPTVVAVKDAKADLGAASEVMAATDLQYYSGDDGLLLPWLSIGAVGHVGVTSHVAPEMFRDMLDAFIGGELAHAQQIHRDLVPVIRAAMGRVPGCVAAKEILKWQGMLKSSAVRLPHVGPTDSEEAAMRADLAESALASTITQ